MSLFLRFCFMDTWKRNRWKLKERFRLFTTHLQAPDPHVGKVISINISLAQRFKMGKLEEARHLFDQMAHRTVSSWNTMISGYSRWGRYPEALTLVSFMHRSCVTLNEVSFSAVLSACARSGSLLLGKQVHSLLLKSGYERSTFSVLFRACSSLCSFRQGQLLHAHLVKTPFQVNVYVGTALVDFYSKCGHLADAQRSFSSIFTPNVAAWTALINGHAYHGLGSEAILLFRSMLLQGVVPNAATFVGVLSACSHAGLVSEGLRIFHSMQRCYGVTPTIEHYTCVVDLLGRSGHVKEAEEFIIKMPIEADGIIWGALLNASWFWKEMKVGERAADKLFSLDPNPTFAFVVLSNIYAILGRWGQKTRLRKKLQSLELRKDPGCSWIELNNDIHLFSVEDKTHPYSDVIYTTVEHITATINSIIPLNYLYSSNGG
uniref:Pentatricopeptide repeat-containing protein At4g02750 family n=1 Tax=Cajanus cajan TaxID=3821 RepID=A0A151S505_CAJCA|nr:Pentatricopeptide repeat-containing protein At4g02750 family [Cajanus cajan]